MKKTHPEIYVIMGVSACGKTTLGQALAAELGVPFFDGDDFHLPEHVAKMAAGQPLNDADREGWLGRLNTVARQHRHSGAVIACSALRERYRQWLSRGIEDAVVWVVMTGTFKEIQARIENRKGHFMPPALLRSQFETLEVPAYGIHLPVSLSVAAMLQRIREASDRYESGAPDPT